LSSTTASRTRGAEEDASAVSETSETHNTPQTSSRKNKDKGNSLKKDTPSGSEILKGYIFRKNQYVSGTGFTLEPQNPDAGLLTLHRLTKSLAGNICVV